MTVNGHNWILEPKVHVLSAPQFFDHPEYIIPTGGTPAERLIAHAGKGCYDSYGVDGRSLKEHITALRNSRHGSVVEHANVSVFITGISRGLSHELVRHRVSFSQRSTRFTKENDASFVLEPYYADLQDRMTRGGQEDLAQLTMDEASLLGGFKMQCAASLDAYSRAVEVLMNEAPKDKNGVERRKWARGKARQLLPHALETRVTMTANLRFWRWIIQERSGAGAEPEIRRLAMHLMNAIEPHAPMVFEDMLDDQTVVDGFPVYKGVFKI